MTSPSMGHRLPRTRQEDDDSAGDIAAELRVVADAHPLVAIGSYPNFSTPDYKVKMTLESKDSAALDAAVEALMTKLDRDQLVRHE